MFVVASKSVSCCHIRAVNLRSVVVRETVTPKLFNALEISPQLAKSIGNKDPILLTFISSCCLGFRTTVGPFQSSSSGYLRDD